MNLASDFNLVWRLALLAMATLTVAAVDEASLFRAMPADLWRLTGESVGRPDANGMFGQNLRGGAFVADNQRRAMDLLVCGVALGNETDIADGWRALEATYQRQEPTGGFGKGANGSDVESMSFFMSWSNHALWTLMNSPQSAAYATRIAALLPRVELAMDRMMGADAHAALMKANLHSPNRSVIMANAYGFAALILARHSTEAKTSAYRQRGRFWIDNVFVKDKLFRASDGVFTEGGGYDTSYQGVALLLATYYLLAFPDDVPGGMGKSLMAGHWLVNRIHPDGTIDCTDNRRSGPDNLSGDKKGSDRIVIAQCLMYWSALHGRDDGIDAARRGKAEKNGMPPVIFSPLTHNAARGRPLVYDVLATNAGLKELSARFAIDLAGLPAWLKREDHYEFSASTGTLRLTGIPPQDGTVKISVTASNEFGVSSPVTVTIVTTNTLSPP